MATFRGFLTQSCQCQREKRKCSGLLLGLVARSLLLGQDGTEPVVSRGVAVHWASAHGHEHGLTTSVQR
jgi:hypothetical protein